MNVFALMIGRAGSIGYPGKNYIKIGNKFCCEYPLIASKKSKYVKKIYVSTDCPKIFLKTINVRLLKDRNT